MSVSSIQTTEYGCLIKRTTFTIIPKKAAFNNLSSIFERLEDPFVKNLLFDYEGYLWMRSSHDIASYDIGGDKIAFHLADGGLYGHILLTRRIGCGSSGTVRRCGSMLSGRGKSYGKRTIIPSRPMCFPSVKTRKDVFGLRWLIDLPRWRPTGSSLTGMHRAAFRFRSCRHCAHRVQ